jgi:pyruvate ferredoxin oxidoreductase alpha subunit
VLDSVILAYKIAENKRVRLPVMVCIDGFFLSHSSELAEIPEQELVDQYLGEYKPELKLDPENPMVFEPSIDDTVTTEFRYNLMKTLNEASPEVIAEAHQEFARLFDREYGFTEKYNINKNTKTVLVAMGTEAETIKAVIGQRKDIGLLRIRVFRPLPSWDIFDTLQGVENIAVLDRDMQSILWQEVRGCFTENYRIKGVVCGLGGRDITPETIEKAIEIAEKPGNPYPVWIDLKEGGS